MHSLPAAAPRSIQQRGAPLPGAGERILRARVMGSYYWDLGCCDLGLLFHLCIAHHAHSEPALFSLLPAFQLRSPQRLAQVGELRLLGLELFLSATDVNELFSRQSALAWASRLALCIRAPGLRRASGQSDGARARAQAQSAAHPCMTRQRCGGRAAPHRTRFCRSAQARRGNCGPSVFGCVLRTLRHRPESAPEPQFVHGAIVRVLRSISHDALGGTRRTKSASHAALRGSRRGTRGHTAGAGGGVGGASQAWRGPRARGVCL